MYFQKEYLQTIQKQNGSIIFEGITEEISKLWGGVSNLASISDDQIYTDSFQTTQSNIENIKNTLLGSSIGKCCDTPLKYIEDKGKSLENMFAAPYNAIKKGINVDEAIEKSGNQGGQKTAKYTQDGFNNKYKELGGPKINMGSYVIGQSTYDITKNPNYKKLLLEYKRNTSNAIKQIIFEDAKRGITPNMWDDPTANPADQIPIIFENSIITFRTTGKTLICEEVYKHSKKSKIICESVIFEARRKVTTVPTTPASSASASTGPITINVDTKSDANAISASKAMAAAAAKNGMTMKDLSKIAKADGAQYMRVNIAPPGKAPQIRYRPIDNSQFIGKDQLPDGAKVFDANSREILVINNNNNNNNNNNQTGVTGQNPTSNPNPNPNPNLAPNPNPSPNPNPNPAPNPNPSPNPNPAPNPAPAPAPAPGIEDPYKQQSLSEGKGFFGKLAIIIKNIVRFLAWCVAMIIASILFLIIMIWRMIINRTFNIDFGKAWEDAKKAVNNKWVAGLIKIIVATALGGALLLIAKWGWDKLSYSKSQQATDAAQTANEKLQFDPSQVNSLLPDFPVI